MKSRMCMISTLGIYFSRNMLLECLLTYNNNPNQAKSILMIKAASRQTDRGMLFGKEIVEKYDKPLNCFIFSEIYSILFEISSEREKVMTRIDDMTPCLVSIIF